MEANREISCRHKIREYLAWKRPGFQYNVFQFWHLNILFRVLDNLSKGQKLNDGKIDATAVHIILCSVIQTPSENKSLLKFLGGFLLELVFHSSDNLTIYDKVLLKFTYFEDHLF